MKFNVEFEIDINDIVARVTEYMFEILNEDYSIDVNNANYNTLCDEVFLAVAKEIIRTNPEYRKLLRNNEDKKIMDINLFENDSFIIRM